MTNRPHLWHVPLRALTSLKPRAILVIVAGLVACLGIASAIQARAAQRDTQLARATDAAAWEIERARWIERLSAAQQETMAAQAQLDSAKTATDGVTTRLVPRLASRPTVTVRPLSGDSTVLQINGVDHPDTVHSHVARTMAEMDSLLQVVSTELIPKVLQERQAANQVIDAQRAEIVLLTEAIAARDGRIRDLEAGILALRKGPSGPVRFARKVRDVASATACAVLGISTGSALVAAGCNVAAAVVDR